VSLFENYSVRVREPPKEADPHSLSLVTWASVTEHEGTTFVMDKKSAGNKR